MMTVSQVARKARVAPNTVRNHVRDFPDLFSEAARGLKGNRLFSESDVEALCSLVALKDSGMPLAEAAERLHVQEASPIIDVAATPLQNPSSPQQGQGAVLSVQVVYSSLQSRMETIERRIEARERQAYLWTLGMGVWIGMVVMAAIFFAVWLAVNGV